MDKQPMIQSKMEDIWSQTCGSWENCNEDNMQSFLSQCEEQSIDPQFCMSWVEQHKNQIPNWSSISESTLQWVNEHTSSGSPMAIRENQ